MDRETKYKVVSAWKNEITKQHINYYLILRNPGLTDSEVEHWAENGKDNIRAILASRIARKQNFEYPPKEKSGLEVSMTIKALYDKNNTMNDIMKEYENDQ